MSHWLYDYFLSFGLSETTAKYANMMVLLLIILVVVFIVDRIIRTLLIRAFERFSQKTETPFDDLLVANKVPRNLAHIVPLILAFKVSPLIFTDFKPYAKYADKALQVFGIILILMIVRRLLNTLRDYFKTRPKLRDKPVDSYIQVFMIFAWIFGLVSIFAVLTGVPFLRFITTIGAASAVILLIFKDTILGFVASIQVSINDMVRIGDWITFEKYGADGDVIEINLATVKVQNFDKTITTIPTYALISDSFRNWRGMMEADGRRIKRALKIKQSSVRFLEKADIDKLKSISLIADYIQHRSEEIDTYNEKNEVNKTLMVNGRNMTNLGVFRKYVDQYLHNHSAINKDMTIMARHLDPSPEGIPIEVYAFCKDKRWENYEYIMADIFDHLIAAAPYFDLELFEYPNNMPIIPNNLE